VYSIDVWAFICRRPRAARAPNSESHLPNWASKVDNWKNGYIAVTQPHVHRLRLNFTRWYPVDPEKLRNCQNPLRVESKMANDAQIFNVWTPISLKRLQLQTSNLVCASTTKSNIDGMQKLGQRGTWPSLGDLDLNLWIPVNISRMAKATGFRFITQIGCEDWKRSSTKGDII